jgi:hypothetical protein
MRRRRPIFCLMLCPHLLVSSFGKHFPAILVPAALRIGTVPMCIEYGNFGMSGLSMADMRRVGVRRNAELGAAEPPKTGFLSKLGFADPRAKMAPEAKTSASASVSTEDACALALRQSKGLLRQSLQRHALAGATITSLTAIGVSGAALSAPIGAVLGGVAGWAVARRAQASPVDQQKGVALAAKSAPALFACFEQGAVQLGFAKPKLAACG